MKTTPDKKFEDDVRTALKLNGFETIPSEFLLGHKKIDALFEKRELGKKLRYAVECKHYGSNLTEKEISEICSTYQPLFDSNKVDFLLIVTKQGISPTAAAHVRDRKNIFHQKYDDIINTIVDFDEYVTSQRDQFIEDPIFSHFVEPTGTDIESNLTLDGMDGRNGFIDEILADLQMGDRPIAILGAYGIGKTTIAKKLFISLSETWSEDRSIIPIYIPLSKLCGEQSIEGLLGRIFTFDYSAPGYNFNRFSKLNRMNKLRIILDGFDEMRHLLSWEEFKFNINEIKKLVNENPHTIMLGRPTAFHSKLEYEYFIHARPENSDNISTKLWGTEFKEYHVDPLRPWQIMAIARKYYDQRNDVTNKKSDEVFAILSDERLRRIQDLSKRPIQLIMLLEILPEIGKKLDDISIWLLFSIFLDKLIEREGFNPARRSFTGKSRRIFAQAMACWLWSRGGESSVSAIEIPSRLVEKFAKPNQDISAVRRDLVMSSFMSTHRGERLHFPHRSIQEFLVAEAIYDVVSGAVDVESSAPVLELKEMNISRETVEFLCSVMNFSEYLRFLDLLVEGRREIGIDIIAALAKSDKALEFSNDVAASRINEVSPIVLFWAHSGGGRETAGEKNPAYVEALERGIDTAEYGYKNSSDERSKEKYLNYGVSCIIYLSILTINNRPYVNLQDEMEKIIGNIFNFYDVGTEEFEGASRGKKIVRRQKVFPKAIRDILQSFKRSSGREITTKEVIGLFSALQRRCLQVSDWSQRGGLKFIVANGRRKFQLRKSWLQDIEQSVFKVR